MTGWVLIICLLILGGVLSTLGDLLGTRIGKARLSIFKLRPKRTAVLITILTGSLISAFSLSLLLLVSRQLRVGLFKLDDLQTKLKESRIALLPLQKKREELEARIQKSERELVRLEEDFFALRNGEVVISSGESLFIATIQVGDSEKVREEIDNILRSANFTASLKVQPGEVPKKRILMVRRDHINNMEKLLSNKKQWVVNIRSAGNVLLGEEYVYAFPELLPNKNIVKKGEVVAKITLLEDEVAPSLLKQRIKLLLSSTLAEVKRRGSLVSEIEIASNSMNELSYQLDNRKNEIMDLEAISLQSSDTAEKISVALRIKKKEAKI